MTAFARAGAGLCAAVAAALAFVFVPVEGQQATFRGGTDVVPVQVSVRIGRTFAKDLTAADFELYDNGVRQEIQAVSADTLLTDVTLVVDTSGSVIRSLGRFKSDVKRIAGELRPGEQVRLITFDSDVHEVFPMQDAAKKPPVDQIKTGDLTSLLDAMVFALARAPRPDRRHIVFVFTDGYDNASMTGYGAIPDLAGRADAVLYIVVVKITGVPDAYPTAAYNALVAAAARTGGALYPPTEEYVDVAGSFKQALEAFRHSYVLYFTPKNVTRSGWHALTVKVTRPGASDVKARQGYFGG
jgi:VWFA-related protein